MSVFRFGGPPRRDDHEDYDGGGLIDGLIDMAGGVALPGKWGVAQAMLEVWTQPMPDRDAPFRPLHLSLWTIKAALNTAGIIREYKRSMDPTYTQKVEDPIRNYVKAKNLVIPDGLDKLGHFIHVYALDLVHEDSLIGPDQRQVVRKFKTASGTPFYFTFAFAPDEDRSNTFMGVGPYIEVGMDKVFRAELAALIWDKEGNSDLQLSLVKDNNHNANYSLTNIGEPDDYVSEGAGSEWASLSKLSRRCLAFQSKNLSRKIMFYGPPGCGKTTLARSLARTVGAGHTLRIEASAVSHAGSGPVMNFVRLLSPRVILFDDLDRCEDTTEEILHYMERATESKDTTLNGVIVIGTANAVTTLDPALLRPGRFDEVVAVHEPCDEHRLSIVHHYLDKFELTDALDAQSVSEQTKGFAPADIRELLACVSTVGVEHMEAEIERITMQRTLYSGDKVENYLRNKHGYLVDDDEEDDVSWG